MSVWVGLGVGNALICFIPPFETGKFDLEFISEAKTFFRTRGHVDFHLDFFCPFRKHLGLGIKGFATKTTEARPRPESQHGRPNTKKSTGLEISKWVCAPCSREVRGIN